MVADNSFKYIGCMDIRIQVVISEIFNTLHTRTHSATECFCSPTRYYLIDVATNFKHLQTCSFGNKNSMVCVFGICVCMSGWTSVCSNSPSRPLHSPHLHSLPHHSLSFILFPSFSPAIFLIRSSMLSPLFWQFKESIHFTERARRTNA